MNSQKGQFTRISRRLEYSLDRRGIEVGLSKSMGRSLRDLLDSISLIGRKRKFYQKLKYITRILS